MSLDYHLSPDSPLLQDGVFERLTRRLEASHAKKIYPLMQVDEYLSLLSFPGVVWFVSKHTGQEPRQAAVAVLSGMPWPLWDDDERQRLLLSVSVIQARLLKKLFRPRKGDLSVVLAWDEPLPPFSKTVEELSNSEAAAAYWLRVASSPFNHSFSPSPRSARIANVNPPVLMLNPPNIRLATHGPAVLSRSQQ